MIKKVVFTSLVLSVLSFSFFCWADFGLSVTPLEGGSALRFGRVGAPDVVTREVRVRITSDLTDQYRIKQRVLEPLQNDRGQQLDGEAVKFYTLQGSNSSGTLYQDVPSELGNFAQNLYTSTSTGNADSFVVVYSVNSADLDLSGDFIGKILYTLIPLQGGGSEQQIILNVYLDSDGKFKVDVTTSSQNYRNVKLSSAEEKIEGYVILKTQGSLGDNYDILQRLDDQLKNDKGEILDSELINFSLTSKLGRVNYSSLTPLEAKPRVIYSSTAGGADDEIAINFSVDRKDLADVSSGVFDAPLTYQIKSKGELIETVSLDLIFDVRPVFDINIGSDQKRGIRFDDVKSGDGPVQKEMVIQVESNLNKPYYVVQHLSDYLTNETGDKVAEENFTVKGEVAKDNLGATLIDNFAPVEPGDTNVFSSDSQGNGSKFTLIYSLDRDRGVKGGSYSTDISYSLLEK
ncbi:MAG: hypothetical protein GY858_06950 [Candidatus Omnitrophica bacterium]|nr:hypothetical protein [Candidatus Omnitrophota bacterium]